MPPKWLTGRRVERFVRVVREVFLDGSDRMEKTVNQVIEAVPSVLDRVRMR